MAQYSNMPGWMAEVFGFESPQRFEARPRYLSKTPVLPQQRTRPIPARPAPPPSRLAPPAARPQPVIPDFTTTVTPEPSQDGITLAPGMRQAMREMLPQPENQWQVNPNLPPGYRFGREEPRGVSDIVQSIVDYLGSRTLPQVGSDAMELLNNIRDANIGRRENRPLGGSRGPVPDVSEFMPPMQPLYNRTEVPTLSQEAGSSTPAISGQNQNQNLVQSILKMLEGSDFNRYVPGAR